MEIPGARTRRAGFNWPVASVAAQRNAKAGLAAAEAAGTRFLLPPIAVPVTPGRKAGADTVIVARPLLGSNRFIRGLGWKVEECTAEMVLAAMLINVARPRIHWRPVEGLPLMHVDIRQYSGAKHVHKRVMDVAMALGALPALSPLVLVLVLVLMVRLNSPGPILFRQDRIGKDGNALGMLKFRSVVADAEARLTALDQRNKGAGVLFKLHDDPQVTRCGRWMRKYPLDELPQPWNVVLGNMGTMGPRPPLDREVNGYEHHTLTGAC